MANGTTHTTTDTTSTVSPYSYGTTAIEWPTTAWQAAHAGLTWQDWNNLALKPEPFKIVYPVPPKKQFFTTYLDEP